MGAGQVKPWEEFQQESPEAKPWEQFAPPPELSTYEQTLQGQQHIPEQIGEGILSALSSVPAAAAGGLRGIWEAAGNGPPGAGAAAAEETTRALTYQPRSAVGQTTADVLSYLPRKLTEGIEGFGRRVVDQIGSPGLATAANVTLNAIPMLLGGGLKTPAVAPRAMTPARKALDDGFTLTPTQLEKGFTLKALEGLAGSPKTEILASQKNQMNANRLIAEDFGIPARTMRESDFSAIRGRAGQAYEEVKNNTGVKLIKPDPQFRQDLQDLRGDFSRAAAEYPELMSNEGVEGLIRSLDRAASPAAMVELTKKLRKDATTNLRSFDDPAKRELGLAQRDAATALENQIDRALTSIGKPDLVQKWRDARRTIAKSHDAEAAFNPTTGNFDLPTLARMDKKGKPLSGGMKKSAEFARAFEGSARSIDRMKGSKNEFGYGDLLLGGIGGLAGHAAGLSLGTPAGLGLVLARPTARHMLLSKPFQSERMRLSDVGRMGVGASRGLIPLPAVGLRMPEDQEP